MPRQTMPPFWTMTIFGHEIDWGERLWMIYIHTVDAELTTVFDLLLCSSVIEEFACLMRYNLCQKSFVTHGLNAFQHTIVPQPIPLTTTLRIEDQYVIIHRSRRLILDLVLESLPPKHWM